MVQEFSVSVWRGYYDQVNILGQYLKDSRPDFNGRPPKHKITPEERLKAEEDIESLLKMSDEYLDKCHIRPREPKWYYDRSNETTWASSEKFKYSDRMARRKYVTIRL